MESQREKIHPLILSSIFHYEVLFLHPFTDGNSRLAQLWQTAILAKWRPFFTIFHWKPRWRGCREDIMRRFLSARWREPLRVLLSLCWNRLRLRWMKSKRNRRNPVESLSKYVKKLLEAMEEDIPYTANEILELLHLKSKDALRKNYLKPRLRVGDQMTIPERRRVKIRDM